MTQDEEIL